MSAHSDDALRQAAKADEAPKLDIDEDPCVADSDDDAEDPQILAVGEPKTGESLMLRRRKRLQPLSPDVLRDHRREPPAVLRLRHAMRSEIEDPVAIAGVLLQFLRANYDPVTNDFTYRQDMMQRLLFGRHAMRLMLAAGEALRNQPALLNLPADTWVFGDVHGNYRDLSFFVQEVFGFGAPSLSGYRILTLGDYVDRGPHSLECLVLLFALKISAPDNVHMLRGNHEDPLVNGDANTYRSESFRAQCNATLGAVGPAVWCAANVAFQYLPLAAIIDHRVFCSHGGIPRYSGGPDRRLEILRAPDFPRYWSLFSGVDAEDPRWKVAFDVLWMDPADDDADAADAHGFGASIRGGPTMVFSARAVDVFLANHNLDLVIRAHQEKTDGLRIAKGARCITVFSSSNYQARTNAAGATFIPTKGSVRLFALQAGATPEALLAPLDTWHPTVM